MISGFYTQTATVLNFTTTTSTDYWSTSTGGSWDTVESIKCAVNLMNSNERFIADKNGIDADYKLYCAPTTNLTHESRIRWDGDTYDVVENVKNTLQKDHHYRMLIKNVQY